MLRLPPVAQGNGIGKIQIRMGDAGKLFTRQSYQMMASVRDDWEKQAAVSSKRKISIYLTVLF